MPVMVTCDGCNKKIKMDDKRIGTMIKCPMCKTQFKVQPVGSGRTIKVKQQAADQKNKAKVAINWGQILTIGGAVLVVGLIAAIYFGPVKTKNEWDEIAGQAQEDIIDVLQRSMAAHIEGEGGTFDPAKGAPPPSIHDVHIFWQPVVMSMPEWLEFKGTSSQGEFKGRYSPPTGEIEATAEIGGFVLPGVDTIHKGDEKIRINGRKRGGIVVAEVNGKPIPPPKPARAPGAVEEKPEKDDKPEVEDVDPEE